MIDPCKVVESLVSFVSSKAYSIFKGAAGSKVPENFWPYNLKVNLILKIERKLLFKIN